MFVLILAAGIVVCSFAVGVAFGLVAGITCWLAINGALIVLGAVAGWRQRARWERDHPGMKWRDRRR